MKPRALHNSFFRHTGEGWHP